MKNNKGGKVRQELLLATGKRVLEGSTGDRGGKARFSFIKKKGKKGGGCE